MSIHLNQIPRTVTESSRNESTSVGHTHAIDKASVTQAGIVKLADNLVSESKTEALTANQGRELAERLSLLAQSNGSKEINERLESALAYLATRYTAAYATYQAARDNLCKHPENSLIYVVNDPRVGNNGLWTIVGGKLIKAPWDVLSSTLTAEPFEIFQYILQGDAGEHIEYNGKTYYTLATFTQNLADGETYIQDVLIDLIQSNAVTASYVLTESGKSQEEINDLTGAPYRVRVSGYSIGERVVLENGNIAQNTVAGNTVNPNVDMTGWVLTNSDRQIKTWSGRTQEGKNKEIISIKDFGAIGDGTYHTIQEWLDSGRFASIQDIKNNYPLTFTSEYGDTIPELFVWDSIDWLACNEWYRTLCKYGGKGFANNGVYIINKQLYSRLSATVNIECGDAKWVASANFPATAFFGTGSSEVQNVYFTWKGGDFDIQNVPRSSPGKANDGWAFNPGNCEGATIEINRIYSGEDWTTAGSDTLFGSSGVDNLTLKVHKMQGAVDAAVYITRKQDGKTGTALYVDVNCYKCNVGVIVKRRFESAIINVAAQDCVVAAATGQAEITVNGSQLNNAHAGRNFVFHVNTSRCQYPLFIQSTDGVQAFVNADNMGVNIANYTSDGARVITLRGSRYCQIFANCTTVNPELTLANCPVIGAVIGLIQTEGSYRYPYHNHVQLKTGAISQVLVEEGSATNNNFVDANVESYSTESAIIGASSVCRIRRGTRVDRRDSADIMTDGSYSNFLSPSVIKLGQGNAINSVANPSYIDLFSAGSQTSRDARIICSGGVKELNDRGDLTIQSNTLSLAANSHVFISSATSAVNTTGTIVATADNLYNLGNGSLRFANLYAATGTINTSDERYKEQITDLSDTEKLVATQLKSLIKRFKFKDAVAEKGNDARWHVGVIAQEVEQAFKEHGLDAFEYGLLCYDTWEASEAIYGADGEVLKEAQPAGNRYGIRYEELIMFILSAM